MKTDEKTMEINDHHHASIEIDEKLQKYIHVYGSQWNAKICKK